MLDFQYFLQPGERVLETPSNPISIGVTLQRLSSSSRAAASESGNASMLGSMLFNRCVWPQKRGRRLHIASLEVHVHGQDIR